MRNSRGTLTVLLLVVGVAVSMSAAFLLLPERLPDPEHCDREALLRWIVTRDLYRESPQTRRTLAQRLDAEFSTGIDWEATADQLDPSQRAQVWGNVFLLLEPWFMDQMEGYFRLASANRPTHLDRVLDKVDAWRGVESFRPADGEDGPQPGEEAELFVILAGQIESWKDRAGPSRRDEITQFQLALQTRWLLRNLFETPASSD